MHFEITSANGARRRRSRGEPLRVRAERNAPLGECDRRRGKLGKRGVREWREAVSEIPRRVEELSNCNSSERDANRKLCRTIQVSWIRIFESRFEMWPLLFLESVVFALLCTSLHAVAAFAIFRPRDINRFRAASQILPSKN